MKPCSKCRKPRDRPGQRYCRLCHNAYQRRTRPRYSELSDEERRRSNCRSYTSVLVRRGHLTREPCEDCGGEAEAHHEDYDKPREVTWLCSSCRQHRVSPRLSLENLAQKWAHG